MMQPQILLPGMFKLEDIERLRKNNKIWKTADIYQSQLAELWEISYPDKNNREVSLADFCEKYGTGDLAGAWVYYPWSGVLVHIVGEHELFLLRTNRNQNLITSSEQKALDNTCVGIFGLSVGNSIAVTLAYLGTAKSIKLTDMDKLETANLNRLKAGLHQVGEPKTSIAAAHIYEVNPYAELHLFEQGIDESNLEKFFSHPKPNVVFDEIDDFPMKIKLRIKAKELRIPVIMLTSLGDNILIDIERYDLHSNTPLFNGLIGDTPEEILATPIGEREKIKYAIDLVGSDNIPTRALESLFEINKTLVGRPQLASTIAVDGGIAAYLVRRLVLGHDVPSGRYKLSFEKALGLSTIDNEQQHHAVVKKLNQMLGR